MLIKKGGISRNIDERNLAVYKAKGFVPVTGEQVAVNPKNDGAEKPIDRMNTDQLKQKAALLGVDISACTTNKQRIEAIQMHLAATAPPASVAADGESDNENENTNEE